MVLVIDCGNTNVVVALFDGDAKVAQWRLATDSSRPAPVQAHAHADWLSEQLSASGLGDVVISDVIISTVVPSCLEGYIGLAAEHLGADYYVLDASDGEHVHGVKIKLPDPSQAGADRIANAAGVRAYGVPALVVDFGTATTFDLVDSEGAYIGGAIAPGVHLSVGALASSAARLPLIDTALWSDKIPVLGNNTVDALNSGLYYGYIGLVEGMLKRLQGAYGGRMTVVATGGLSALFARAIDGIDYHDPDLTIKGMVMIYRYNRAVSESDSAKG